jgi:hypothetical protein
VSFLARKQEAVPSEVPLVVLHQDLVEVSRRQIASSPGVETGGKFLGYVITAGSEPPNSPYGKEMAKVWRKLAATECLLLVGSISPGPRARRTATELLPDGDFQTAVFRSLESTEPTIEHLGTWHSHHPNGLNQFSPGDLAHYQSVIVDKNYEPDFFVAGLCVDGSGLAGGRVEIFGRRGSLHTALGQDRLAVLGGFPSLQPTVAKAERALVSGTGGTGEASLESALAKHFTIRDRQADSDSLSWVITDRSGSGFLGVVTQARGTGGPVAVSLDVTGQGTTLHYDGPISGGIQDLAGRLLRIAEDLEAAGRTMNRRR